jgi:hypothetical protein
MNKDLAELEKQKLNDKYNRYLKAHRQFKRQQLQYLWEFLHTSPFFAPLCKVIKEKAFPRFDNDRYQIVWKQENIFLYGDEEKRICRSYLVIEDIVTESHDSNIIYSIGKQYMEGVQGTGEDCFKAFNELFFDPLKSYLFFQMETSTVIGDIFREYKDRTQWFTRNSLYQLAISDPGKSERSLLADMRGYLYDNGIQAIVEPASPAGRPDYVGVLNESSSKILVEGKVFDGEDRSKKYLARGFEQLRNYLKDYHDHAGYLVVFNLSPKHLDFETGETREGFPVLLVDNRVIYFIVIEIYDHDQPASTRPKAETIKISRDDLVG